jgi:hypothetical protein
MAKTLTFLHTSPVHIATFDQLLAAQEISIPVKHIVDESLLEDARTLGITPSLYNRIATTIDQAFASDAAVVVCTCSTIGGSAEQAQTSNAQPVLRVDRAMAEQAILLGERITIAAALTSTLSPTRHLLEQVAHAAGKAVTLNELWCSGAWAYFEQGDMATYWQNIARELERIAKDSDVIVLAQASMAGAVNYCSDIAIPILSSPRLGLQAAIEAYRVIEKGAP